MIVQINLQGCHNRLRGQRFTGYQYITLTIIINYHLLNGMFRRLRSGFGPERKGPENAVLHGWTGFADRFAHLRTGTPPEDSIALMTAVLADATNLGLARMAHSSGIFSHSKLLWTAEWHIRDETYQAGLACLVEAIHAPPFTAIWGDGDTSSSDGQFFRAGGYGEARAEHNARYGSAPGVKFYTHISNRYAPFYTKVIAANASEALHVLDGLLHHENYARHQRALHRHGRRN